MIPHARTRRGAGLTSLQDALNAFLRSAGLEKRLRHERVLDAWSAALGEELAGHARAVRFQNGELTVEVESSAHLHELRNFTGEGFRRAANARLEEKGSTETIRRVAFKLKR